MSFTEYSLEGADVRSEFDGGSSVSYQITGEWDAVSAAVRALHRSFPTPGYGTWFNWPPNGPNTKYLVPKDHGDGRFTAFGHRSVSCD